MSFEALPDLPGEDGEEQQWEFGEEPPEVVPNIYFRKKSRDLTEAEKIKEERCEKFRQILGERQEIRRKNIFLQKKMVEFFKRRKMDHVLKEDPKGLDLGSKYLKRLYELQEYKKHVAASREVMLKNVELLREETMELQENVRKEQNEFFERQKKVALSVQLKSRKKISAKVRSCSEFSGCSAMNAEEIHRLRLLEIKEKRLLEQKQNLARSLDCLGLGFRRADYELLNFMHETTAKLLKDKESEAKHFEEKVGSVAQSLNQVQKRSQQVKNILTQRKQQSEETKAHMIEIRQRLQKLKKMAAELRKEQKQLELRSGLLTNEPLLQEFESSLAEMSATWRQLETTNAGLKRRLVSDQGGQVNTPEDFFTVVEISDSEDEVNTEGDR